LRDTFATINPNLRVQIESTRVIRSNSSAVVHHYWHSIGTWSVSAGLGAADRHLSRSERRTNWIKRSWQAKSALWLQDDWCTGREENRRVN